VADYDVGAAGLSSPPSSAVLTTYRPAILVRNYGIHARLATGYIRIYRAGVLVFQSNVYSGTIQPGATGVALAELYWTPTQTGSYFAQGYVSCINDQVASNNPLNPVPFVVTTEPPPPPPIVTPHASQHEDGGDDQLTVDGLPGQLAEPQTPYAHASNHQQGGSDSLNVDGLAGQLADEQKPAGHGNEAHSPSFATNAQIAEDIGVHNSMPGPHSSATNLEKTANRGAANGYAALDSEGTVPVEQLPESVTTGVQHTSEKDQPNGYAGLDGDGQLDAAELPEGLERTENKGVEDGYCPLDADALVANDRLPADIERTTNRGQANGYPSVDEFGNVIPPSNPNVRCLTGDDLGVENGVCPLDGDGEVPTTYLQVHNSEAESHPDKEVTANKGEPGGYAPLDEHKIVPAENLPPLAGQVHGNELHDPTFLAETPHGNTYHTTAAPEQVSARLLADEGAADDVARADHLHPASGGKCYNFANGDIGDGYYCVIASLAAAVAGEPGCWPNRTALRFTVAGRCDTSSSGGVVSLKLYIGDPAGSPTLILDRSMTFPVNQTAITSAFRAEILLLLRDVIDPDSDMYVITNNKCEWRNANDVYETALSHGTLDTSNLFKDEDTRIFIRLAFTGSGGYIEDASCVAEYANIAGGEAMTVAH